MPNPLILPLVLVGGTTVVLGTAAIIARRRRRGQLKTNGQKQLNGATNGTTNGETNGATDDTTTNGVGQKEIDQAVDASEVIRPLIQSYKPASFHVAASGDSLAKVARQAVKSVHPTATDQQVAAMRRAIGLSEYNRQVAGEPHASDYFHPGGVSVDKAFMPKHEGADVLRAGFVPRRNISATGSRIGAAQQWAALWIPDINEDALKAGTSDVDILFATEWEDGTSGREPPPLFWNNAVVRPPLEA